MWVWKDKNKWKRGRGLPIYKNKWYSCLLNHRLQVQTRTLVIVFDDCVKRWYYKKNCTVIKMICWALLRCARFTNADGTLIIKWLFFTNQSKRFRLIELRNAKICLSHRVRYRPINDLSMVGPAFKSQLIKMVNWFIMKWHHLPPRSNSFGGRPPIRGNSSVMVNDADVYPNQSILTNIFLKNWYS